MHRMSYRDFMAKFGHVLVEGENRRLYVTQGYHLRLEGWPIQSLEPRKFDNGAGVVVRLTEGTMHDMIDGRRVFADNTSYEWELTQTIRLL